MSACSVYDHNHVRRLDPEIWVCDSVISPSLRIAITISPVVAMTLQAWGVENIYENLFFQKLLITKTNYKSLDSICEGILKCLVKAIFHSWRWVSVDILL